MGIIRFAVIVAGVLVVSESRPPGQNEISSFATSLTGNPTDQSRHLHQHASHHEHDHRHVHGHDGQNGDDQTVTDTTTEFIPISVTSESGQDIAIQPITYSHENTGGHRWTPPTEVPAVTSEQGDDETDERYADDESQEEHMPVYGHKNRGSTNYPPPTEYVAHDDHTHDPDISPSDPEVRPAPVYQPSPDLPPDTKIPVNLPEPVIQYFPPRNQMTKYWQGDIILPASLQSSPPNAVYERVSRRWPKGHIPFYVNQTLSNYVDIIRKAAFHINAGTAVNSIGDCINLWECRGPSCTDCPLCPRDHVAVSSGDGTCSSWVGQTGGVQSLNLGVPYCIYFGTIVHEFLHAVGFFHTQQRTDRDDYIKVYYENIIPETISNFDIQTPTRGENTLVYDYNSIMHYGMSAFAKPAPIGFQRITMEPRQSGFQLLEPYDKPGMDLQDVLNVQHYYQCYLGAH